MMDIKFVFLILLIVCGVIYSINSTTTIENKLRTPIRVISVVGAIFLLILFGVNLK